MPAQSKLGKYSRCEKDWGNGLFPKTPPSLVAYTSLTETTAGGSRCRVTSSAPHAPSATND